MDHQHRYVGFNEGGRTVRRCASCFQEQPTKSARTSGQAASGSVTLPAKRKFPRRTDG